MKEPPDISNKVAEVSTEPSGCNYNLKYLLPRYKISLWYPHHPLTNLIRKNRNTNFRSITNLESFKTSRFPEPSVMTRKEEVVEGETGAGVVNTGRIVVVNTGKD
uniref:Uncharacterized protein n=1 Tax=Cacopsylla melanoneura TaxID=428564 RepID=A0A8D8TNW3_9HEMI